MRHLRGTAYENTSKLMATVMRSALSVYVHIGGEKYFAVKSA